MGGICGLALFALLAYLLVRSRNRRAAATLKDPPNAILEEMDGAGLQELSEEQRLEMEGNGVNELSGDVRRAELRG